MTDLSKADDIADRAAALEGVEDVTYYKDTVDKLLYINLSDRYRYNILFLVAGAYQCYHASRR